MQVVLYDQNTTYHTQWSDQFVKFDPLNRKRVGMNGHQSAALLTNTIRSAIQLASGGGTLIFAVGHGGASAASGPGASTDPTALAQGMVDLAPNKKMRLARGGDGLFVDPFYNWVFEHPGLKPSSDMSQDASLGLGGAAARQQNWALYQQIGTAVKSSNLRMVVFLTCNIGNATNFVKKIALDWNVVIRAYKRYVWFVGSKPTKACLDGDQNGGPTLIPEAAYQLPQVDFVTVGPPLKSSP